MKKLVLLLSISVMVITSCQTSKEDDKMSLDEIKKMSTLYHERNLEDIDKLLSDDFVGNYYFQGPNPGTWKKEDHKKAISTNPNVKDSILIQIVEGDWVAERFIRTFINKDTIMKAEFMQFKQFKNGKFISSWELAIPIN